MPKASKKDAAPAGGAQEEDIATVELAAPAGWKKLLTPRKTGTPLKNEIFYITPTGEEVKSRKQLASYLKSHPGGPLISEFDWSTGDTPRRSSRLSEKQKAAESPETTPVGRKRSGGRKAREKGDEAGLSEKQKEAELPETAPGGRKRSAGKKTKEEEEAPETEPPKKKNKKVEQKDEAEEGIQVTESDEAKEKGEAVEGSKTSEAEMQKVDVGEHAKEDVAMETEKTEVEVDEEKKEVECVEEVQLASEVAEETKISNEVEMDDVIEEELPGEEVVTPIETEKAEVTMEEAEKVEHVEVDVTIEATEQTKTTLEVENADLGGEAFEPQPLEPVVEEPQQHVDNAEQIELVEEGENIKVTIEKPEYVEVEKEGEAESTEGTYHAEKTELTFEEAEKPETNTNLGYKEEIAEERNEREITEDKSAVHQQTQEGDKEQIHAVDGSFPDEKAEEQHFDTSNPTEDVFVEADFSFPDFTPPENEIPPHDVKHMETVHGDGQPAEDFPKDIAELEESMPKLIPGVMEAPPKEEIKVPVMESGFFEGKNGRVDEGEVPYRSSFPVGLSDGEKSNHIGGSSQEEGVRRDAD